jgi:cobalt-zinc-cadmium efflux system outer membrane protein
MQAVLVFCALLGFSVAAAELSETGDHDPSMTLQEAISRALTNNPGIKASRIDVDIEQARRDALSLGTPYELGAEVENFAGTGTTSGFDSSETTLQLSRTLELGSKRQLRTDFGDARLELTRLEMSARETELAAEVSRRYVAILKQQEEIKLAAETAEISSRTLESVMKRVSAGRATEAEESSAVVALARSELAGRRLSFELLGAQVGLAVLWGSTQPTYGEVAGDIYKVPVLPDVNALNARVANNPLVLKIVTQARIQRAQQNLAQSKQRPDIQLTAGVRHLAASDDVALVAGFTLPFGTKGRAAPLIREADSQVAKVPLTRDQQMLNLQATLVGHYQSLRASRDELETLRNTIIPEAQLAVQFYERGFEVGSFSLLELIAAQERLLALRREALDAAGSFHLTLIEIETLLGSANPGGALL